MIQTVTAIERDGMDVRVLTVQYEVPDKNFDLMGAIKKAATAYVKTESGRKTLSYNCGAFNLADFISSVPDSLCRRFGFKPVDDVLSDIEIDWNLQLVEEEIDYDCDDKNAIPYRDYILAECKRQWSENQRATHGRWEDQSETDRKTYFKNAYDQLWPNRFDLEMVIVPDKYEFDGWEKANC